MVAPLLSIPPFTPNGTLFVLFVSLDVWQRWCLRVHCFCCKRIIVYWAWTIYRRVVRVFMYIRFYLTDDLTNGRNIIIDYYFLDRIIYFFFSRRKNMIKMTKFRKRRVTCSTYLFYYYLHLLNTRNNDIWHFMIFMKPIFFLFLLQGRKISAKHKTGILLSFWYLIWPNSSLFYI